MTGHFLLPIVRLSTWARSSHSEPATHLLLQDVHCTSFCFCTLMGVSNKESVGIPQSFPASSFMTRPRTASSVPHESFPRRITSAVTSLFYPAFLALASLPIIYLHCPKLWSETSKRPLWSSNFNDTRYFDVWKI